MLLQSCFTLADEKMLKAYIEYSAEKDKYYYFSDYMSVDRNVKIDHTEEIEEYFLSAGKPMRLDDVFSTLSHIPQERVDRIIKTDSRFLRNSKGEYFHTDILKSLMMNWRILQRLLRVLSVRTNMQFGRMSGI